MPVSALRPLRPACFVLGAGLLAYAGCSSSGNSGVSVTHPTLIEVSPAQFLGGVPCAADGPGLKSYVATLYDTNETTAGGAPSELDEPLPEDATQLAFARLRGDAPREEFELPSSAPAPCSASVGFGYVVPGRRYEVLIEGYEQAVSEVEPRALGSHLLVAKSDPRGPLLSPTFQGYCRRAIPVDRTTVIADDCAPFAHDSTNPAGPPSLSVPLGAMLGSFACGTEDEQVEELRVELLVGADTYEQVVDCSADAEAVFEDLPLGIAEVYVAALPASGDASAVAGATCDARLVDGERVSARCNRLSAVGTLRVDLEAALEQVGLSCDNGSVSNVRVLLGPTEARSFPPPDCQQTFELGVEPGNRVVTVEVTPAAGAPRVLNCYAEIEPGKLNLAVCEPVTS